MPICVSVITGVEALPGCQPRMWELPKGIYFRLHPGLDVGRFNFQTSDDHCPRCVDPVDDWLDQWLCLCQVALKGVIRFLSSFWWVCSCPLSRGSHSVGLNAASSRSLWNADGVDSDALYFRHPDHGLALSWLLRRDSQANFSTHKIDGCGFFGIYRWILLPISMPAFAVVLLAPPPSGTIT
ncbi:MAG: hypothetical protein R2867_33380 [Caldilineaceae bacterium]